MHAILVNLDTGNQLLSSANGSFDAWLIWTIVADSLGVDEDTEDRAKHD